MRLLAVVVAMACGLAHGQAHEDNNTRSVEGLVRDSAGAPASKAVVLLKDTKSLQIRSFVTADDGSYHFAGLSANVEYELRAQRDGTSGAAKTLGVYDGRKKAVVNLRLNK